MEPRDASGRNVQRARLGAVAVGVLALAVVAMSCHVWDKHLDSVHPGGGIETYCVLEDADDVRYSSVTTQAVDEWVLQALSQNNTDQDWEWVADFASLGDCGALTDSELFNDNQIQYRVTEDFTIPGCEGAPACADGFVCTDHDDHNNCSFFITEIDPVLMTDTESLRLHVINHETGHVLGLADPTPVVVPNSAEDCWTAIDTNGDSVPDTNARVYSIMHDSGYCGETFEINDGPFPTFYDIVIVESIAGG